MIIKETLLKTKNISIQDIVFFNANHSIGNKESINKYDLLKSNQKNEISLFFQWNIFFKEQKITTNYFL